MTILCINGSLFCVPDYSTGVISICNNKYGSKLSYISRNEKHRTLLNKNDSIVIRLIAHKCSDLTFRHESSIFPSKNIVENGSDIYGFKMCVNNDNIYMPFHDDGSTTIVVTVNKGIVWFDAGSITNNKLLLDYYHSEMNIGDEICITVEKLDFISFPIRERYFKNCSL